MESCGQLSDRAVGIRHEAARATGNLLAAAGGHHRGAAAMKRKRHWETRRGANDAFIVDDKALHAVFDFIDRAPSNEQSPETAIHLMKAFSHFASSALEQLLDVGPDDVFFDSLLWDGVTPTELQALVASSAEGGGGAVDRVEWLPGYGAALLSTGPGPIKRIFIVGLDTWRLEELRDG